MFSAARPRSPISVPSADRSARPICSRRSGTRASAASSALTVRARDAHRALPERRHTVQPQDRHLARPLTIPFPGEHTIHGLIRGANTGGRLAGVTDGGFNRAGQHPPGWNGVGEPGVEVEVFAGRIPPDAEGGLQVVGMDGQPNAEGHRMALGQLHRQKRPYERTDVRDLHHDRVLRRPVTHPGPRGRFPAGQSQHRVRKDEPHTPIVKIEQPSTPWAPRVGHPRQSSCRRRPGPGRTLR